MFPKPISWLGMEKTKLNTTKAHIYQSKAMYNNIKYKKKLKSGLIASYDIRPGNGEGLFWFQHFINLSLTYLLRHPLTYSPHGAHTTMIKDKQWHWTEHC